MRLAVNVQGRVQGVGFRATTRAVVARQPVLLSGWVRNEQDRSVQIELQGPTEAVQAALAELRSVMARNIRTVTCDTIPEVAGEQGFIIAR